MDRRARGEYHFKHYRAFLPLVYLLPVLQKENFHSDLIPFRGIKYPSGESNARTFQPFKALQHLINLQQKRIHSPGPVNLQDIYSLLNTGEVQEKFLLLFDIFKIKALNLPAVHIYNLNH